MLDCLESEPELRAADVLADAAALAVDLEWLGRRDLARALLDRYRDRTGENHPRSLEDFYCALAALRRCQLACRRLAAGETAAAREARVFAELAWARLRRGRVRLVLVGGQRGTGKSTLADGLAAAERWTVLRFDDVAAAWSPPPGRPEPAAGHRTPVDGVDAVHQELLRRAAAAALRRGESVVVDAPWNRHGQRLEAAEVARRVAADLVQLRCTAPPDLAATRVDPRRATPAGPAGPARLADSVSRGEPWPEARSIDTAATAADALRHARRAVV
ncbi:AAA family ATPase [Frankia sp. CpI1-P]|nr:AAA family ATPase [Frankia sp. CpI1-P]